VHSYGYGASIDHDITFSETGNESVPIPIPRGDPVFDPLGDGSHELAFFRSLSENGEQINFVSSLLDGSVIYGSQEAHLAALRCSCGSCLRTSIGDMLPMTNASSSSSSMSALFVAGDKRVNEHVGLSAMHTIWVREHNRWANAIRRAASTP